MSELDQMFAEIGSKPANMKGRFFKDGKGIAVVREIIAKKGNDGRMVIFAVTVVSSASKGDVHPETKIPVVPDPPGTSLSWPQLVDKHKSAAGNVKAGVLALAGFREADVTPEDFAKCLAKLASKEQPARGMLLGYETYQQETRSGPNKGKINTYVRWIHVPPSAGNTKEEIEARRAELDKTYPL